MRRRKEKELTLDLIITIRQLFKTCSYPIPTSEKWQKFISILLTRKEREFLSKEFGHLSLIMI
jgi:hypothetical protein